MRKIAAAGLLACAAIAGSAWAGPAAAPVGHAPAVPPADAAHIAPAGVGALDAAVGTQLSADGPAWLALPAALPAPSPSVAWVFGLGFLGFVVLRRVRSQASSY